MLVTVYAPHNGHALAIAGLSSALFEANQVMQSADRYELRVVTRLPGPILCGSGLRLLPDGVIAEERRQADTVIVVGAHGVPVPPEPDVVAWLGDQARGARRYGSVGSGAVTVAAASLPAGRRVTTHWRYAERLAADHPKARDQRDMLFARDGPLLTAAADLALALIEADHGQDVALRVARCLVVSLRRPAGPSQFSVQLVSRAAHRGMLERVHQHVLDNPGGDLGVAVLAGIAGMSLRSFSRSFRAETGVSPASYVSLTRVDVARRMLERTDLSVKAVMFAAGFGSAAAARRAFLGRFGLAPAAYRRRFRSRRPDMGALAESDG